ncbi:MAG: hypothetical protein ACP5JG_11520 [Anaerolineae bacterium]
MSPDPYLADLLKAYTVSIVGLRSLTAASPHADQGAAEVHNA